jgi:DNA-binding NarL/FixJ family response regulator
MDIAMKPLDGLQASARIKGCFPDAQIIILTQYNDAGLHAAATKSGACGYVLKENLLQVRELIEAESRREPARHR